MNELSLKVMDKDSHTLAAVGPGMFVNLAFTREYRPGDRIILEVESPGVFCEIRFDDAMIPAVVYIDQRAVEYQVPFGEQKQVYSDKSFSGSNHLVTARILDAQEASTRRNLALNPYDQHEESGMYPHARANVETRGESVFAARNAIDGTFANQSHGNYPFQSWGINRRPDAELTLDLGLECCIDLIRLTTRADFPHDNYWTEATLLFSDGREIQIPLGKEMEPQSFPVDVVTRTITVKNLKLAPGLSPFPALTQIEAWGTPANPVA
ncbi:hypothetical protein U6G28_10505 [Actinomycetaceae bacterium MB13-C1-2]|nr:hypothetical protein U6G28_10505 [Actinomycetaceae bacterium MB13-C1-2]